MEVNESEAFEVAMRQLDFGHGVHLYPPCICRLELVQGIRRLC